MDVHLSRPASTGTSTTAAALPRRPPRCRCAHAPGPPRRGDRPDVEGALDAARDPAHGAGCAHSARSAPGAACAPGAQCGPGTPDARHARRPGGSRGASPAGPDCRDCRDRRDRRGCRDGRLVRTVRPASRHDPSSALRQVDARHLRAAPRGLRPARGTMARGPPGRRPGRPGGLSGRSPLRRRRHLRRRGGRPPGGRGDPCRRPEVDPRAGGRHALRGLGRAPGRDRRAAGGCRPVALRPGGLRALGRAARGGLPRPARAGGRGRASGAPAADLRRSRCGRASHGAGPWPQCASARSATR